MGHASVVGRGLDLFRKGWRPLAALVLFIDVPSILGEAITVGGGYLPVEMAAPLWALVALVLLPLSHGATLFILKGLFDQNPISTRTGLRSAAAVWSKYQVAYLYMSFVILGWVALFLVPGFVLMMAFGLRQVWFLAPFGLAGIVYAVLPLVFQEPFFVTLGMSPWEARLRSRALVRGRWGLVLKVAAMTMGVPIVLEYSADLVLGFFDKETGIIAILLKAAFGTLAAFLYIVPAAVFYVLFRDLTGDGSETLEKSAVGGLKTADLRASDVI